MLYGNSHIDAGFLTKHQREQSLIPGSCFQELQKIQRQKRHGKAVIKTPLARRFS